MSLPDVLHALKASIMDGGLPVESFDARYNFLKEKFPGLTKEEAEDLAKIPADKLSIYAHGVFSKHRSFFKKRFPMTGKVLAKVWPDVYGSKFVPTEFVKKVHNLYPWRSTVTLNLAGCILSFVQENLAEITDKFPIVKDLAYFEYVSLVVMRALTDRYTAKQSLSNFKISELTVEELLDLNFIVPASARFERFQFDVLEFKKEYRANGKTVPDSLPEKKTIFTGCGRDHEFDPVWCELPENLFGLLNSIERDRFVPLSTLAERMIENRPGPEEELFGEFLRLMVELKNAGVIVIPPRY